MASSKQASSTSIMELPTEIVLKVAGILERSDLKSVRLVSRTWCSCASTFLFDQIYVSSAKEDLEIFEAVTRHPLLSRCVRHLKYDAAEFLRGLTKREYLADMCAQRPSVWGDANRTPWNTPDLEVNDWVNEVIIRCMPRKEACDRFENTQLVLKGYQSYTEHAIYQQSALESGQFTEKLTQGIAKLAHLSAVTLEGSWGLPYSLKDLIGPGKRLEGSYLARHWNHFYCQPQGWEWGESLHGDRGPREWRKYPDGIQSYDIITSALARASRRITSFAICNRDGYSCPGLPPTLFDTSESSIRRKLDRFGAAHVAFADLETFIFPGFALYAEEAEEGERVPEIHPEIDALPALLSSMHRLKRLELTLCDDYSEPPIFYNNHQALPKNMIWHRMESMTLVDLSISAKDLMNLLLYATPNLLHLEMGCINLLKGSWEAFFAALARSKRLRTFKLQYDTYLFHHNGVEFSTMESKDTLHDEFEEYVVHGGHHPSLRDDQPDSAAEKWLQEFDEML